jgi:tRNA(adenine34) deaminase
LPDVCWCLVLSQISKIVFGASDEHRGFVKWNTITSKTVVKRGVLEEASDLMKRFFATKRR